MGGYNKAFLRLGNSLLLNRILATLKNNFSEILLITRECENYRQWELKIVSDIYETRSPLSGIHAGLLNMEADYAFCIACDTPFLKKELIEILLNEIRPSADVIVPFSGEEFQPLCAVYSKQCIGRIEEQIGQNDLRVDNLFDKVSLKKIPYEKLKKVDPQLISFFNVNTPADLRMAKQFLNIK
jgi:molybdopterin-guanine dinucleotide biosynthesis protein A